MTSMRRPTTPPSFDEALLTAAYLADPYRFYRELRERDPVHWSARLDAWVLTRFEDVKGALRDPRFVSGRRVNTYAEALEAGERARLGPLYEQIGNWIGNMDPPDHTRLRRLVNVAFTPRMVEDLRPRIVQLVDRLLDEGSGRATFDFIAGFAYPLPAIVIAEILGVPPECRDDFMHWSDALTRYGGTGKPQIEVAERASAAAGELSGFFRQLIADRRCRPAADLITGLIQAEEHGERLSEREMLGMCGFLLVAGHETTMSLLGNGLLALLRHPEQLRRLRNDPALIPSAVEECLRYDSPLQHQTRVAAEDVELRGTAIRRGARVLAFLGAANRDPEEFPRPDEFDVARSPNRHVAFGFGIHFCLGAPLARLEMGVALERLIARLPCIELDRPAESLHWRAHTSNRAPVSLPVRIR